MKFHEFPSMYFFRTKLIPRDPWLMTFSIKIWKKKGWHSNNFKKAFNFHKFLKFTHKSCRQTTTQYYMLSTKTSIINKHRTERRSRKKVEKKVNNKIFLTASHLLYVLIQCHCCCNCNVCVDESNIRGYFRKLQSSVKGSNGKNGIEIRFLIVFERQILTKSQSWHWGMCVYVCGS